MKKYLMVTSWDNHRDKVGNTYYTKGMFREGMHETLLDEENVFIK